MATANFENLAAESGSFLTNLLGLKVTVSESTAPDPVAVVAAYVDSNDVERAQILCDLSSAAMLGAALTQIPMGSVEDSIECGELSDNLKENVSEVFNISVNVLPNHDTHRFVLKEVRFGEEATSSDDVTQSEDFEIEVQRYGKGHLRIAQLG
ncbi:MAG: hypothetical protein AAF802_17990 [Planctomycetota bacterium]